MDDTNRTGSIDYDISNSIRCSVPGRLVYFDDWRYLTDDRGWTAEFNIADVSYLGGSLSGVKRVDNNIAYIEQPLPTVGVVATTNKIEIALKIKSNLATTAKLQFITQDNEDDSYETIDSLGQYIEFDLINDGNYHLYKIDPNGVNSWQGVITRFRLFPFMPASPGDSFSMLFFRLYDISDDSICIPTEEDFFETVPSSCTGAGRGFSVVGDAPRLNAIQITEYNNSLEININGFGFRTVGIKNTSIPVKISKILDDIQAGVNNIGSSGYVNATVYLNSNNRVVFTAGSRTELSSIELKYSPLLEQLGFFNRFSKPIYTIYEGVDDSESFESFYELNNDSLNLIRNYDLRNYVTFNPEQFLIEGGNPLYSYNYYLTPVDMSGYTLIDYLRPINNTGKITKGYFYGSVIKEPRSKIKIFRPIADNKLRLIAEEFIEPDVYYTNSIVNYPNIRFNQLLRDFTVDLDINVQIGDLVGLSNVIVYGYASYGEDLNLSFMLAEGDIIDEVNIEDVTFMGHGFKPLPVYVRSDIRREKSLLFFDLKKMQAVDKIVFNYKPNESIKTGSSLSSSVTEIAVDTKGSTHTHWRYKQTPQGLEQESVTQTTTAFNTNLLLDGVKSAFNGTTNQYFYLDGDGDPDNTDFTFPGLVDSSSFITDLYDIIIDLSPDFDKEISIITLYFVEPLNWIEYGLFYEKGGQRIPFEIVGITFDDRPVSTASAYYINPLIMRTQSDQTDENVQNVISYTIANSIKRKASFMVKPVTTRRVIFEVYRHFSTKMTEIELSSPEVITEDGYNIEADDVFDVYVAGEDFVFSYLDFNFDDVIKTRSLNTSYMTIGKPIRYAIIEIKPPIIFDLFNIKFLSEKTDDHSPRENDYIDSTTEYTRLGISYDEDRVITIRNELDSKANLYVDILRDNTKDFNSLVFYSELDSLESIEVPEKGPSALYKFSKDNYLKVRYNILKNRPSFGTYQLNSTYMGKSDWVALGNGLTDDSESNNIDAPVGGLEGNPSISSVYTGESESGGTYSQNFTIIYTVHIDITNGAFPGLGENLAPTFTVTSSPALDDVSTPVIIENINTFYPVGTLGVLIRFNDFIAFGPDDIFVIRANPFPLGITTINARDYGYVAVDIGQSFHITDTEVDSSAEEMIRNVSYSSWPNDSNLFAITDSNADSITRLSFNAFGQLNGPAKWIMLSWDFNQPDRGGWLNKIRAFAEEPIFYSDMWWDVAPNSKGFVERDLHNFSSDNSDFSSVSFKYTPSETTEVIYSIDPDAVIDFDSLWSFRDFASFNILLTGKEAVDYIKLRIGTTETDYYEWSLPNVDESVWTNIDLRFTDASIVGEPELYTSITYFAILVKGNGTNQQIAFNCDSFHIRRNKFDDVVKDGNGLYLSNKEFVGFYPVDTLTLARGTVEFWFKPDYNSSGYFEHTEVLDEVENSLEIVKNYKYYFTERIYTHTILNILTGFDFLASLAVESDISGLRFRTNNFSGDTTKVIKEAEFTWNEPHHISIIWKYNYNTSNIDFRVYLDGEWVLQTITPWQSSVNENLNIILGGSADPEFFSSTPSSACGVFENLKIYNYPKYDLSDRENFDFDKSDYVVNSDLFFIDVNNSGFNKYGSVALPLVVRDVESGDTVTLKVRFYRPPGKKIPKDLYREARIECKWELF